MNLYAQIFSFSTATLQFFGSLWESFGIIHRFLKENTVCEPEFMLSEAEDFADVASGTNENENEDFTDVTTGTNENEGEDFTEVTSGTKENEDEDFTDIITSTNENEDKGCNNATSGTNENEDEHFTDVITGTNENEDEDFTNATSGTNENEDEHFTDVITGTNENEDEDLNNATSGSNENEDEHFTDVITDTNENEDEDFTNATSGTNQNEGLSSTHSKLPIKTSELLCEEDEECNSSRPEGNPLVCRENSENIAPTSDPVSQEHCEQTEIKSADSNIGDYLYAGTLMRHLFEKQLYTDVTFYFEQNKAFLSAHRAVLAAKCDFFESLLFGKQMKDAVDMKLHIQINDVPFGTFSSIIKYFYTDDIELADDCTVLEIYKAATSYRIHRLVDRCQSYVDSIELTENNVCSKLEVCNTKNIGILKTRCIRFISENTYRVISSKDFERCSFSTLREICKLDVLSLNSEVELLEAALRWRNVQKRSKQAKINLKKCLLKCVRFLSFTPRELSEVMQRHPHLLTPKEGLNILIYLNNRCAHNMKMLPQWSNKKLRIFQAGNQNIRKSILRTGCSDRRKIQISLKSANEQPQATRLTSILHMRCIRNNQKINNIKFSFESVAPGGCVFGIRIGIVPNGPIFFKRHVVKSKESVLSFEKPPTVFTGQTVRMEIMAETSQQCKFLQFDDWRASHSDFQCFFISIPKTGRLYFISRVEYQPIPKKVSFE